MSDDDKARTLIARDKAGESLTATEWAELSLWHAREAVRWADRAVFWSRVGLVFAALGLVSAIVAMVLR